MVSLQLYRRVHAQYTPTRVHEMEPSKVWILWKQKKRKMFFFIASNPYLEPRKLFYSFALESDQKAAIDGHTRKQQHQIDLRDGATVKGTFSAGFE